MGRSSRLPQVRCTPVQIMLYLVTAGAIAALDQLSKTAVVANIPLGGAVPAVDGLFQLTFVRNTGAAWSVLSGHPTALGIISCVAVAAIGAYMLFGQLSPLSQFLISMVIGGAVGNLIDRFRLGYVVDMIELTFMDYPVFNVADSFIVVGGIAFAIVFFFWNDKYLIKHGLMDAPEGSSKKEDDKNDDQPDC